MCVVWCVECVVIYRPTINVIHFFLIYFFRCRIVVIVFIVVFRKQQKKKRISDDDDDNENKTEEILYRNHSCANDVYWKEICRARMKRLIEKRILHTHIVREWERETEYTESVTRKWRSIKYIRKNVKVNLEWYFSPERVRARRQIVASFSHHDGIRSIPWSTMMGYAMPIMCRISVKMNASQWNWEQQKINAKHSSFNNMRNYANEQNNSNSRQHYTVHSHTHTRVHSVHVMVWTAK